MGGPLNKRAFALYVVSVSLSIIEFYAEREREIRIQTFSDRVVLLHGNVFFFFGMLALTISREGGRERERTEGCGHIRTCSRHTPKTCYQRTLPILPVATDVSASR